MIKCD